MDMRRTVFIALLFVVIASCGYRPTYVDRPAVQPGIGSSPRAGIGGRAGTPGGGTQQVRACRVLSRQHCETATCKGKGMDLVTLSCQGEKITRCELGKGGC